MKKLNEAVLRRGDIVLVTSRALLSTAIKLGTASDISHALICVEGHSVIDATSEGVQARNTQRLFYDATLPLYALRLRGGLSSARADTIISYVREHIGAQYSTTEAVRSAIGGASDFSRKQFCSRLVAQAYAKAGIQLVADPNYCSPADLKNSAELEPVDNCTLPVSDEDAAFAAEGPDLPRAMRESTNIVLNGVRKLGGDIQNLSDVTQFVIQHPEHDLEVCRLYRESGYLTVWMIDTEHHPYHYDVALMRTTPLSPERLDAYCKETISDENASQPNRYIQNLRAYTELETRFQRRTFALLKELYAHLARLHQRRVDAAHAWMAFRALS